MKHTESLQDFYKMSENKHLLSGENKIIRHFNIFPRWRCSAAKTYIRRDFYRIVLTKGSGILSFLNHKVRIDAPSIFIANKIIPYSWEPLSENQDGWVCLFSSEFLNTTNPEVYPVLNLETIPIYNLDNILQEEFSAFFEKIEEDFKSDYIYKYALLQNYLNLLLHRIQMLGDQVFSTSQMMDAAHRTVFRFLELLEQQFPVQSPEMPLDLKSPQDYARKLNMHVNHLNSSVKKVTGNTSSGLITERIVTEARSLLQNTDWNISEISDALGFEYPSYFTNFLKKHAGASPKELRLSYIL
ncbi:helix-turn-helix domain-containing protein [Dysgonomonas macrotermitis]|uniref:Transcriptional regulator, AraC family n=1 Tax=Dysgonomonas macrotermitis TaxID=1346286 RepID=A0A1M4SPR1_9BACT|nr:helix-turn-helix transcriptional regulator [Dysgonomonas macrotermitis]SHE34186.1 transcriptional regulator, AraC family [Dysgonomonas macrotermitis]